MKLIKRNMTASSAKKLKEMRTQLDFSCKKMAAQFEISYSAYFKNENGESYPSLPTLYKLHDYYDISMDWFMFDKGPMYLKDKENAAQRIKELEEELQKCNAAKETAEKELEEELQKCKAAKETAEKELMITTAEKNELKVKLHAVMEEAKKEPEFPYLQNVEPDLLEMVNAMNENKGIRFKILSYFYECRRQGV